MKREKPLVCVVDSVALPLITEVDVERRIFGDEAEVMLVDLDDPEHIPGALTEASGLIVAAVPRISGRVLESLQQARIIVRNGVGYDNIDAAGARAKGIAVANVPDYCTEEVADHAIMLAVALERNFSVALKDVCSGRWSWKAAVPVRRLRGQKFGIVGCGRIGTAVVLRARAFGFEVGFYDPYVRLGHEKALGVERFRSLDALLEASDVVSLHAPLTAETAGMIGECQLAKMKPGAFLVNTARGPLVQEQPLIHALQSGRLAGVALDVLEREPAFSPQLLAHPNCLLTPHVAFYSEQAMEEVRVIAARTVLDVLRGETPPNIVN